MANTATEDAAVSPDPKSCKKYWLERFQEIQAMKSNIGEIQAEPNTLNAAKTVVLEA